MPWSPIHRAAQENDAEALRRELASGVSPNATDPQGRTPLYFVCIQTGNDSSTDRRLACIKLLIEAGADPNIPGVASIRWSSLHIAAAYGRPRLAAVLLEAGANANQLSRHEQSPLHVACEYGGSIDCVALLIRSGATVNARDDGGKSPLDRADSEFSRQRFASPRKIRRIYATLLRAGAELPAETESQYLRKVIAAGSFRNYERAHLNKLAGIFAPKFSRLLPPEMVRRVLEFAYPVGDH